MLWKLTHNVIYISVKRNTKSPADFNITHTIVCVLQAGVGLSIKIMGDIREMSEKTPLCGLSRDQSHTCSVKAVSQNVLPLFD